MNAAILFLAKVAVGLLAYVLLFLVGRHFIIPALLYAIQ